MKDDLILNTCRICEQYLDDGVARYNDFIAFNNDPQFKNIQSPICENCAKTNPDELHLAYKNDYVTQTETVEEKNK